MSVIRGVLGLALLGVGGCSTSEPLVPRNPETDPVIAQLNASGRSAYSRGAVLQASSFYEQSLARARASDRGADVGFAAYNLAACRMAQGRIEDAHGLLREAVAEFSQHGLPAWEALLLEARAAQALGQTNEAAAGLARVTEGKAPRALKAEAVLLRAGWALAGGDTAAAEAGLAAADKLVKGQPGDALLATQCDLRGQLLLRQGQAAAAAGQFDREADAWRKAQRVRDVAQALNRSADAWNQAGDAKQAADRWYRAGRSLFAQGEAVSALTSVASAVKACESAGDEDLNARVAALFSEISAAVERAKQTAAR